MESKFCQVEVQDGHLKVCESVDVALESQAQLLGLRACPADLPNGFR